MPLRVVLADDAAGVREVVTALLERDGFEVVGTAADGLEAIQLAQAHRPDVAVLDIEMPRLNGLDAAHEILELCPGTQTILLSVHREKNQILAALRGGIRGYLIKAHAAEELGRAIREVAAGGIFLSSSILRLVVQAYLANLEPPRS